MAEKEVEKPEEEGKKAEGPPGEAKKPLVYFSRVRELLIGTYEGKEQKLNISGAAKEPLTKWLEEIIKLALESLVEGMPHKEKGEQKGQLNRKTVKKGDLGKGKRNFREKFKEPTKPKKKGKK